MLKVGMVIGIVNPRRNEFYGSDRYIKHRVISIIHREDYNMYVCEDIKTKVKNTITDVDIITSLNNREGYDAKKYSKDLPNVKFYIDDTSNCKINIPKVETGILNNFCEKR